MRAIVANKQGDVKTVLGVRALSIQQGDLPGTDIVDGTLVLLRSYNSEHPEFKPVYVGPDEWDRVLLIKKETV